MGGRRAMVRDREFNSRLQDARSPAAAYWLAAAIYMLVYLFPVPWTNGDIVFRNAGDNRLVQMAQDWTPSPAPDPVILPPAAGRPENAPAAIIIISRPDVSRFNGGKAPFDSRGPPALS